MIVLCFPIEPARPLPLPDRADSSSTPHTSETVCRWVFSLYICLGKTQEVCGNSLASTSCDFFCKDN